MKNRVLDAAAKAEKAITQFLVDIVSIPSPSRREKKAAQRIAAEMEALGYDEVRFDGLGSVVGRVGSGPRALVFDGHIDTVDVGTRDLWDFDPFDAKVVDNWVLGRGTVDQKGGVASAVHAAKIMKELGLCDPFTIYVTGTVMEEDCDGLCWQYLVEEEGLRPDFAVITEPTDLCVYRGQRGRMEISVTIPGLSAHGSMPERGENAVTKMAPVVLAIDDLNRRLPADPFLGKGSAAVTEIRSVSPSLCAVPDGCSIHIDRRLTWGETEEGALAEINGIIGEIDGARAGVLEYAEKSWTNRSYPVRKTFPAWKMDEDHAIVRAAEKTRAALFGAGPVGANGSGKGCWTFSTNGVAIRGMKGIPAVGFGPGNEAMAHAPNEKIPVDHLVKACAFYALFPAVLAETSGQEADEPDRGE